MSRESLPTENRIRQRGAYDYSLLFLTIFLVCFGLVMIYSASSYNAMKYYSTPIHFLKKQLLVAVMSIPAMIVVSKINYWLYVNKLPIIKIRPIWGLYIICIIMQTYVLIKGEMTNGAQRWIQIGSSFKFQPSEVSKICLILLTAYLVQKAPKALDKFKGFIRVFLIALPLIALVVAENFSTALIMLVICIAICFVASRNWKYFVFAGIICVIAGAILIFAVDYRGARIDIWLNVETNPDGYQILQGLYAIANGGLFGKGLGNSMQKLGYIPEAHNDIIFAVICEELGIFGAISVLVLFVLLIWRLSVVAANSDDLYGGLIAVGVLIHIAVQVIINVAVVTNSIPSTGIPLPFVSYGGTSLMVLMLEMGIALSVSNRIKEK